MPYGDWVYVGTTDTVYSGDPGDAVTDAADVAYLVDAVNPLFEGVRVSAADVISSGRAYGRWWRRRGSHRL